MSAPKRLEGPRTVRPFLFVGGGLGDVARRFYQSTTYELLGTLTVPTPVICYSHNPAALDFFRFHPNHNNIVLLDMGHLYMSLIHDKSVDRKDINRRLFAACGFHEQDQLARRREPRAIGSFPAPDALQGEQGHVVIHPFGRGQGDWPAEVADRVRRALAEVPATVKVFVISAEYTAMDGKLKKEEFPCDWPNVQVLKNLSAPAVFTLVASASRFIGTMSALAQVAAFENIPSLILHPNRCKDFRPPANDYGRTILERNGIGVPYEAIAPEILDGMLGRFLRTPEEAIRVATEFADELAEGKSQLGPEAS